MRRVFLWCLFTLVKADHWNPFTGSFDISKFDSAPAGFGQFPSFNFPNTNFGAASSGVSPSLTNFGNFGPLPTGADQFKSFQDSFNSFSNLFGSATTPSVPSITQAPTQPPTQPPTQAQTSTVTAPAAQAPTTTPSAPAPTTSVPTTTTLSSATTSPLGPFVVTGHNCTNSGVFFGITSNPKGPCGSVECTCVNGLYVCYSNCNAPPAGQTCTATVSGTDMCPTYSDCAPYTNKTIGDALMFRCSGSTVHPAVCWLYEMIFGKLTAPLAFFDAVANDCTLTNQCVCSNGFVVPAPMKREDFKTPANNVVYPRPPGNKGTIA